jgi:hypothetical protein
MTSPGPHPDAPAAATEQPDMLSAGRPGPARWLAYAFGAGLPARCNAWVLHDVTCSTWWLRHLARAITQLAVPILLVCVLLPGPAWIRVVTVVAATGMGLVFSLCYMVETGEHRLVKAGYPSGSGERLRQRRAIEAQHTSSARRRERIAERQARRRA